MKIIKKLVKYLNDKGEEKTTYNFYIKFDNGSKIAVKPCFKDDYSKLVFISESEGK